jgi:hypothetical protein
MGWLFYKGEFQREIISPTMTQEHGIRTRVHEVWPQEWGRDAIVVTEGDSGYFMHWVPTNYYYCGDVLKEIGVYPTFDRHPWREMINLWFMLKP